MSRQSSNVAAPEADAPRAQRSPKVRGRFGLSYQWRKYWKRSRPYTRWFETRRARDQAARVMRGKAYYVAVEYVER